jgi:hypothetical protein
MKSEETSSKFFPLNNAVAMVVLASSALRPGLYVEMA